MNKRLEDRLTMYEGVLSLLQANDARISSVPGMAESVKQFTATISTIKKKNMEAVGATAGRADSKYQAQDDLIAALLPVCSSLYVYARKQGDPALKVKVDLTEAGLRRVRDTLLASTAGGIADLAAATPKAGIPPAAVTDLRKKVDAFTQALAHRETGVASRMSASASMMDAFRNADELLEDAIDRLMEHVRQSDPEMYNGYFTARIVRETGVRHRPAEAEPPAVSGGPVTAGVKA